MDEAKGIFDFVNKVTDGSDNEVSLFENKNLDLQMRVMVNDDGSIS